MNKKLGAVALLGAWAVVLAGCAGGGTAAPSEPATGDLTVWLVGTDTPAGKLLGEQGSAYGVDGTAAALSWVMAHPARVIPIVGSQNPARVRAAADAYKVEWTREEWYAVMQAGTGEKLP